MYDIERENIKEAYEDMLDEIHNVDEEFTIGVIEGNWKKITSHFNTILEQLNYLEKMGVYNDKKYGKKLKKIDKEISKLTAEMNKEFYQPAKGAVHSRQGFRGG